MKEIIISLLREKPIAYRASFSKMFGDVSCGVFLSQLFYWSEKESDPDGIYKTIDDWYSETGLSRRNQTTARKKLKAAGVLRETKKGVPAKLYYQINFENLYQILSEEVTNKDVRNVQTRMCETYKQGCAKRTNKNVRSEQTITENTKENTTKSTTKNKSKVSQILEEKGFFSKTYTEAAEEIREHFSQVTGHTFNPSVWLDSIKTLLNLGYSKEDFMNVHINKYVQWVDDPERRHFIRPATLYQPKKFDAYKEEAPLSSKQLEKLKSLKRKYIGNSVRNSPKLEDYE